MHEAVGRTQSRTDAIDPARAAALHVTLGQDGPAPGAGDALPPFYHQIYFWEALPADRLGRDGHPATGQGLIPDLGLPQRMWAGGRLAFDGPFRAGIEATKTTTVEDVQIKTGRSGRLGFVTLRHEIAQGGVPCVTEWQDIVYREPPETRQARTDPPRAPQDAEDSQDAAFDVTLLFRYSALTFNGHRIHYDADYCRDVEGYAGLVVHGPLLAQRLMLMADRRLGGVRRFRFRATSPLIAGETGRFCAGADGRYWVSGADGRQCMEAWAE
ncbi:FAS1-like dehydratase domain-containing protein [Anianabacter salinae]|uniref:FAS1-like dehydratase domain-containing protein n=1 Tax=Anianabacter salinae TaxID=2851023 RepID=UPI00225E5D96|nr:MaoC family dehydratase N-terminal domain-containing protein [Anianabacter salinae]MBV0910787.1 MaoC family dehydratase N-terminal domain-containing protein [Anianabacter salinae]